MGITKEEETHMVVVEILVRQLGNEMVGLDQASGAEAAVAGRRGDRIALLDARIAAWPVASLACTGTGLAGGISERPVCASRSGEGCRGSSIACRSSGTTRPCDDSRGGAGPGDEGDGARGGRWRA
jgi:hypothetical protein